MATRRDQHEAKKAALAALGKDLSRRAGSACELCAGKDVPRPQVVFDAEEPSLDDVVLACESCRSMLDGGRLPPDAADLRFLETAIWAEVVPAQIAAVRLLRRLVATDVAWAAEANETLWLDVELEDRV